MDDAKTAMRPVSRRALMRMYDRLLVVLGPQCWWPADSAEEVMFGAVLAQNTSWRNAKQAIDILKAAGALSLKAVAAMDVRQLGALVRPARFFNQKARALKALAAYLGDSYGFSLKRMAQRDLWALRSELLSLYRIGPETADSILLYALNKPVFVVDLYTKRICSRHGYAGMRDSYDALQHLFMCRLPPDVSLFNEFHALLVSVGNRFCGPRPRCEGCPLRRFKFAA